MAVFCPFKAERALYLECQECENKTSCNDEDIFALLVAGSRSITNKKLIYERLDKLLSVARNQYSKILIIEGGAKGVDEIAGEYAKDKGYLLKIMPADWSKYGKAAGYIRNKSMHELLAKYKHRGCALFWDGKSKGTQHNFEISRTYETALRIIKVSNFK